MPIDADRIPGEAISDLEIAQAISAFDRPVARSEIQRALAGRIGERALRARLASMVRDERLLREGERRWVLYRLPDTGSRRSEAMEPPGASNDTDTSTFERSLGSVSRRLLASLARPVSERPASGYRAGYAAAYVPGATHWLDAAERARLHRLGTVPGTRNPAGTYARRILDRLLIDLSFNSSRLESNTYSLLDTRRLLQLGVEAPGHDPLEAQMIRNHRDAIEFLIENAEQVGFDRRTLLNLHAMLASELLPNPADAGRLRTIPVGIGRSTYLPETVPQRIETAFTDLLVRLATIDDPFEQALVTLAQLPYLQPFVDVNKRVSRLAANIPLIRANLVPISFVDVPRALYTKAVLAVYELEDHALLKELFLWSYERSVRRYTDVRQSLDAPDPFRIRHRETLTAFVADAVRRGVRLDLAAGAAHDWALAHVDPSDLPRFVEMAETELLGLHEGNFARFRLRPSEFDAWQAVQEARRRP